MLEATAVLLAVAGALAFVMRMDDDPSRWRGMPDRAGARHRRPGPATRQESGSR